MVMGAEFAGVVCKFCRGGGATVAGVGCRICRGAEFAGVNVINSAAT